MAKSFGLAEGFDVIWNGSLSLIGIFISIIFAVIFIKIERYDWRKIWPDLGIVILTGIYGLIAVTVISLEE